MRKNKIANRIIIVILLILTFTLCIQFLTYRINMHLLDLEEKNVDINEEYNFNEDYVNKLISTKKENLFDECENNCKFKIGDNYYNIRKQNNEYIIDLGYKNSYVFERISLGNKINNLEIYLYNEYTLIRNEVNDSSGLLFIISEDTYEVINTSLRVIYDNDDYLYYSELDCKNKMEIFYQKKPFNDPVIIDKKETKMCTK